MKALTNYIAALITVSMIFLTVAFFITSIGRQVEISNYALNSMVQISERGKEVLGITYIVRNNTILLTLVNNGGLDISLREVVIIDKDLRVYKRSVNTTTIPIGSIINLNITLPVPFSRIYSIKITTFRGNVFDVLSSPTKPLDIRMYVNVSRIDVNDVVELTLNIYNGVPKRVIIDPTAVSITFTDHGSGRDVSNSFTLVDYYPSQPIYVNTGEQLNIRFVYKYGGGLASGTSIDITAYLNTYTSSLETIYGSGSLIYGFKIT